MFTRVALGFVAMVAMAAMAKGQEIMSVQAPGGTVVRVQGTDKGTNVGTAVVSAFGRPRGEGGIQLTFEEKRILGFSHRNVRRIVRELRADGFITPYTYQSQVDAMVFAVVKSEADPEAVRQLTERLRAEGYQINDDPMAVGGFWDEIDWDELFAFLEKLINLIMKFFANVQSGVYAPAALDWQQSWKVLAA